MEPVRASSIADSMVVFPAPFGPWIRTIGASRGTVIEPLTDLKLAIVTLRNFIGITFNCGRTDEFLEFDLNSVGASQGSVNGWQINTTGWVSGAGRNYLIAVLTNGNASEQYGIDTVNAVSGLVWQALGP